VFSISWSDYLHFMKNSAQVPITAQQLREITRLLHRDGVLLFLEKGEEGACRPGAFDFDGYLTSFMEDRIVFHMKWFLNFICHLSKQVCEDDIYF